MKKGINIIVHSYLSERGVKVPDDIERYFDICSVFKELQDWWIMASGDLIVCKLSEGLMWEVSIVHHILGIDKFGLLMTTVSSARGHDMVWVGKEGSTLLPRKDQLDEFIDRKECGSTKRAIIANYNIDDVEKAFKAFALQGPRR